MQLEELLYKVSVVELIGDNKVEVKAIAFDSKKVKQQTCFFAQKGTKVDGHRFIDQAINAGANVIVCEEIPSELKEDCTYVRVDNSSEALGKCASNFYKRPSQRIKLVGVTGTNGKTTIASLLYQLFKTLGYKVGLISTVIYKVGDEDFVASHTTPDAIQLNQLLDKMVERGCEYCFMEVSSHAVVQNRIAGLHFAGGVFTNITHEHLDFHKTFKEYIEAKRSFFNQLPTTAFALSNKDDKNGEVMLQETKAQRHYYALKTLAEFKAKLIDDSFEGLNLKLDGEELWSPLIGLFNAYNLTSVYATARLLGMDKVEVLTALSTLSAVDGRFQRININKITGIVDYAHSPDALENVLKTIRNIGVRAAKLITVVGCGGDRDREKRPVMAKIAALYSDRVILTSDNPRTEDPSEIIEEMKPGLDRAGIRKTLAIVDRKEAIRTACSLAEVEDIILVAGKGHETYQEINGVRNHFDDMEVLVEALNELNPTKV